MELYKEECKFIDKNEVCLNISEINFLLSMLDGWVLVNKKGCLEKKYNFLDFDNAFKFVEKISKISQNQNHHPDIFFGWGYVKVNIFSHDLKGLHRNDFIVASKIDKIS